MKKDLIFAPALLVAYAVLTKKEWKLPALEIVMRVFYAIALITGIVIMNVHGLVALAVIHKLFAALFFIALVGLFVHKLVESKKTEN